MLEISIIFLCVIYYIKKKKKDEKICFIILCVLFFRKSFLLNRFKKNLKSVHIQNYKTEYFKYRQTTFIFFHFEGINLYAERMKKF